MGEQPREYTYLDLVRTIFISSALAALQAEARRELAEPPPTSPYQGHEGQRPGESFTAYRIRVRKEEQSHG